jgi:hypothetical protein
MKKTSIVFIFTLVIALAGFAGQSFLANAANPQIFGGHYYQVVYQDPVTWQEARTLASGMTYSVGNTVYQGRLAIITSAAENKFIYDNLVAGATGNPNDESSYGRAWIGASQTPDRASPSAGWQWVNGKFLSYTNWDYGSPDDGTSSGENNIENYLEMRGGGYWDDVNNSAVWVVNYVVEFELPSTPQGVGGEVLPINKMGLLAPVAAMSAVISGGVIYLLRRKARS